MDVFEFRDKLVNDYRDFTRSFIQPSAEDISTFLDSEYDGGRYWPSPLIQINPSYGVEPVPKFGNIRHAI